MGYSLSALRACGAEGVTNEHKLNRAAASAA